MIGTILGQRYEILEKIGSGGMGNVYKAHDRRLDRIVAIKILKTEYNADENFIRKFKRESLAAASISHPNIVSIYDVGAEEIGQDSIYYIVMEYIEGRTLKEIIMEEGPIAPNRALNYTIQIAEALKVAHGKNIVHRDIKSQNIMVTRDNRVKVTDFGIARVAGNSTVTMTNSVMGSVHYFSPEQAKGAKVDHRSDIYSMGIVLYEMLTGDVPYDAENPISVALMHIQNPLPPPSSINPIITPSLDYLVDKMTKKDSKDRYSNVDEIIKNIKDLLMNRKPFGGATKSTIPIDKGDIQRAQVVQKDILSGQIPKDKKYRSKDKKKKNSGPLLGAFVAILLFLGILFVGYKFLTREPKPDDMIIPVPSVIGMNVEEAKTILEEKEFIVALTNKEVDDREPNIVLEQDPEEGTEIEKGSTVQLVVSTPVEEVLVPNVQNRSLDEARKILSDAGLALGSIRDPEYSDSVDEDLVIRTNPEIGTSVKPGTEIDIFPSKGPKEELAVVPELRGITVKKATQYLEERGLEVGEVSEEYHSSVEEGLIFYQKYQSGNNIPVGTKVDVKVSLGPEKIVDEETEVNSNSLKNIDLKVDVPDDNETHSFQIHRIRGNDKTTIKSGSLDQSNVITVDGKKGDVYQIFIDGKIEKTIEVD
ncbi:MAG: Stk1 family PASTA domain-containing Ser/Thr kinase [Tissierellia bacterium]|nr:Stk1 family PASTA domain-containing Ser/Thr kinase [Tissierellia bacterium]